MEILEALDTEWIQLGTSTRASRAFQSWARSEAALAGHDNPVALLSALRQQPAHPHGHQALNALAHIGLTDPLARRTALQLVIPVIARRAGAAWPGRGRGLDRADLEAEAVRAALTRIDDLGHHPVPRAVFAVDGTVRRALQTICRVERRNSASHLDEDAPIAADLEHPERDLLHLIAEAIASGDLARADADLVLSTRLAGLTIQELARQTGTHYKILSRRRLAAEALLAGWLGSRFMVA
jgi:hypothetical protein